MAGIAGLVSAGLSIYGATQGGGSTANNVQLPQQWTMNNQLKTNAANNAYDAIGALPGQQIPGQVLQQYQQYAQNAVNNPYAGQFQGAANTGAALGQNNALGAYGLGQQFQQAGASMIPGAQQIMQTAFDPQNDLYARTQQQLVDQTRAGQAARGVATTPYGAAGESDALRKFNVDWQNNQLGRQVAGAGAAGNLLGDSFKTAGGGAALSSTGANEFGQFGAQPYGAYSTISQAPFSTLNSLLGATGQAQQIGMNPVNAYLQFLGVGNQAQQTANQGAQIGLNQNQLAFNQNQTLGSNLGGAIGGIGKAFSPSSSPAFPGAQSGWNWLSSFGGAQA